MKVEVAAKYDVVIIGSGVSGLICALELAKKKKSVCIVTKEAVTESSSLYAQGGIAVPKLTGDSIELHLQDTLKAGSHLNDAFIAKEIISAADEAFNTLISYGVEFDSDKKKNVHFTKEAAHSLPRVCHIGGDSTGRYLTKTLIDRACRESNISISQGSIVLSVLKDENGSALGILTQDITKNFYVILAQDIIIATGGIGQIYKHTTNPKVSTGDGVVLAYSIGGILQDIEMIQFHPTVLLKGGDPFLITEAIRGEGAKLKNIHGDYFATRSHELAELAPRDVLARAISFELEKTNSDSVLLDISSFTKSYFKNRFPSVFQTCLERNLDLFKIGIPVSPAAHYLIGGIKTDLHGSTNIPNLWAIGECASTGFHGANRLASNSLLECVVIPLFVVKRLLNKNTYNLLDKSFVHFNFDEKLYEGKTILEIDTGLKENNLKSLGLTRSQKSLEEHLKWLHGLKNILNLEQIGPNYQIQELKNKILLSSLICQAAINRDYTLGAHYRSDSKNISERLEHTIIQKDKDFSWLQAEKPVKELANLR